MNYSHLTLALLAAGVCLSSCKSDDEDDLIIPPSSVQGISINEVCSSGTDWVELYNSTDKEVNLAGYRLQDDKGAAEEYTLPADKKIPARGFLVLEKEKDFAFGISGGGDAITLLDTEGAQADHVAVPALEDGQTYARVADGSGEWKVTSAGTKGSSNTGTPDQPDMSDLKLYINEVMSAPAGDDADFVELYNAEDRDIDLSGFQLQDDKGSAEAFTIPQGTVIPAKGIIVYEQVSPGAGASFTFGLSSKGDKVTLLQADGKVVDEVATPAFTTKGSSYARLGDGGAQWQVTDKPTKGLSNGQASDAALKGILMINEVYTFSDQKDPKDLDYIELYNNSDREIDLSGLKMWESGGPEEAWTFPQGKKIKAKGLLVIETDKEGYHNDPANYPSWGLSKGPDEYIVLADANSNVIDEVRCPSMKQHESYGRVSNGAAEWQIFAQYTRGTANQGTARQPVKNSLGLSINEVFTNNQDTKTMAWDDTKDFIELYNSSRSNIDLSGFSLMDDALDEDKRYTFPQGTVIKAGGFLTLDVYKKNPSGPVFGLGKGGDWVFLYDKNKKLIAEIEIPALGDDQIYTVGRQPDGSDIIKVFKEASKGSSNNGKATVNL